LSIAPSVEEEGDEGEDDLENERRVAEEGPE